MIEVKFIFTEDLYHIRHQVLRKGQPISSCKYPHDHDPGTFHLGGFEGNELISIASFYTEKSPKLNYPNHFRIRGMATLPQHEGKGAGALLVEKGLEIVKGMGGDVVWCNARTSASGFYKKLGFSELPEVFQIEGIGPHKLMFRKI